MIKKLFILIFAVGIGSTANAQDGPPTLVVPGGNGAATDAADGGGGAAGNPPVAGFTEQNKDRSASVCAAQGASIVSRYANQQQDVKGRVQAFFYDAGGRPCFILKDVRVTEGDLIVVGYFGEKTGSLKFKASQTACGIESPDGRIRDQFISISPKEEVQFGGGEDLIDTADIGYRELDKFDCYGAEAKFKVSDSSDDKEIDQRIINQYSRYYATWQVGALWTDLHDRDYMLVDRGAGNVISSDIDDSDGPLYVGSIMVYGLPNYLKSLASGKRYSGRDIINHNEFFDRVGLTFSFGLKRPADTFGVGLSYEIVRGVSLTYSQLYRKIEVLDGLSEGDAFSSADIPTKESWEDEGVWGISIDGRLIAKFFGGGS